MDITADDIIEHLDVDMLDECVIYNELGDYDDECSYSQVVFIGTPDECIEFIKDTDEEFTSIASMKEFEEAATLLNPN